MRYYPNEFLIALVKKLPEMVKNIPIYDEII